MSNVSINSCVVDICYYICIENKEYPTCDINTTLEYRMDNIKDMILSEYPETIFDGVASIDKNRAMMFSPTIITYADSTLERFVTLDIIKYVLHDIKTIIQIYHGIFYSGVNAIKKSIVDRLYNATSKYTQMREWELSLYIDNYADIMYKLSIVSIKKILTPEYLISYISNISQSSRDIMFFEFNKNLNVLLYYICLHDNGYDDTYNIARCEYMKKYASGLDVLLEHNKTNDIIKNIKKHLDETLDKRFKLYGY